MKKDTSPKKQNTEVAVGSFSALTCITLIMALALLLVSFFGLHVTTAERQITELSNDWILQVGVANSHVQLPGSIRLEEKGVLKLSHVLPTHVTDGSVLLLEVEHQNLMVQVEDDPIYLFESTGVMNDFCGQAYQFIPLTREMAGKKLTLYFTVEKAAQTTYVNMPVIGRTEAVVSYLLKQHAMTLLFAGAFVLLGVVLLVISLKKCLWKEHDAGKYAAMLGCFFFLLALWRLLSTGVVQLLGERESFTYLLTYICHTGYIVPLLFYISRRLEHRYVGLIYLGEAALLTMVVTLTIFARGAADLYQMVIVGQALVLVIAVVLLVILTVKEKTKDRWLLAAVVTLVLASFLELCSSYIVGMRGALPVAGVLYLVLMALVGIEAYNQKKK